MPELSAKGFQLLIKRLDADPGVAAEKYEILRLKLTRCVMWKGCADSRADTLADRVLDRVAGKLESGVDIENITAYANEVLRYIWLEELRREPLSGDLGLAEPVVEPQVPVLDPEDRMNCLRRCLVEVVPDVNDRRLILGYYDADAGRKNKDQRKDLAARFGLSIGALKVKASRLRAKLEACITECVERLAVTKSPKPTL